MSEAQRYLEREIGKERKTAKEFFDLKFRVKKLRPHGGDIVVLSHDDQNFDNAQAVAKSIGAEMEREGRRCLLLVLGPGITIDTLDEAAMRKAGWARMSPELREAEAAISAFVAMPVVAGQPDAIHPDDAPPVLA